MYSVARALFTLILSVALAISVGCEQKQNSAQNRASADGKNSENGSTKKDDSKDVNWAPQIFGEYPIKEFDNYIETGDLEAIKKHGKLRILVDISSTEVLPRAATKQDIELERAKLFVEQLGLEPIILYTDDFDDLIPLLLAGKGDAIANNLTITDERKTLVDFSTPTATTKLVLVSRQDTPEVKDGDELKGKTLSVTQGTTYETKAREFVEKHPGVKLKVLEKNYVDLTVDVAQGHTDFTIIDEVILDLVRQFRDDLKKNIVFPGKQDLAWAIRKNSPEFLKLVNEKVRHVKLTRSTNRSTGDLDEIKKRGVLRAVTRNTTATYFMWKGRILGYEFELLEKYAKKIGVRLEMIVAPEHDDYIEILNEGKADIAASLLSVTERRKQQGMSFSTTYLNSKVGIVARKGDEIKSYADLAGRTVYVRKSSSQYDDFVERKQEMPKTKLELIPEDLNVEQIIDKVAEGTYDLAIVDEISVQLDRNWRDDIHFAFDFQDDDNAYAWMMRDSNPELLKSVNQFFKRKRNNSVLNTLYKKYFESPKRTRPEITKLTAKGHISPYDALVQKYSDEYDFDWRLVTAQMFQESTFNPKAKSWVGARGLMQVMPNTGKQVGESNLYNPENSVRAGLKYLEWLHEKFVNREDISPANEMWFTLAAYNAGLGHVYDAKDLAEEKGWDRKIWFGNVEKAMLLLAEKKYYSKARYGYARGQEPVDYVKKIEARFRTYVALLEAFERDQEATSFLQSLLHPAFRPEANSKNSPSVSSNYRTGRVTDLNVQLFAR